MKDSLLSVTKALPNSAAANQTAAIDLNIDPPKPAAGSPQSNKWRLAFVDINIPALTDHTNTSVKNLFTLQDSADNSTFANTNPLIQVSLAGVASTGSVAAHKRVPLPPDVRRYIRFAQDVPTNGGNGTNANVSYDLVT